VVGGALVGSANTAVTETKDNNLFLATDIDGTHYRSVRMSPTNYSGYIGLSVDAMDIAANTGLPSASSLYKNLMYINGYNGNVGIGTTGPTGKTDIQGLAIHDLPTYSAEFLLGTTWVSTDWTGDFATGWTHTTGNVSVLSNDKVAVNATKYQIAYTVTGRTAGSFAIVFGGQSSGGLSATGAWGPTTSSTASLTITPTTDFNGTIVISIKSITAVSTPLVNLRSSDGTARIEMRANNATGNTFIGNGAGRYNTTGSNNTANGVNSLFSNTTGASNTANGFSSLFSNTTGSNNTANGYNAGRTLITGNSNTFFGYEAGYNASQKTDAVNSMALGNGTFTTLDNQVVIGNTNVTQTLLNGNVGIGTTNPTAVLHLKAGTATAGTAPFKFTSGTLNTTPEAGTLEYNNTPHFTNSDAVRRNVVLSDGTYTAGLVVVGGKVKIKIGGTEYNVLVE
jgi:hypothetical protein